MPSASTSTNDFDLCRYYYGLLIQFADLSIMGRGNGWMKNNFPFLGDWLVWKFYFCHRSFHESKPGLLSLSDESNISAHCWVAYKCHTSGFSFSSQYLSTEQSGSDRRERTVRSVLNGQSVLFYHNHSGGEMPLALTNRTERQCWHLIHPNNVPRCCSRH